MVRRAHRGAVEYRVRHADVLRQNAGPGLEDGPQHAAVARHGGVGRRRRIQTVDDVVDVVVEDGSEVSIAISKS